MLEQILKALQFLGSSLDDDPVDKVNSILTLNVLLASAILISYKQFGGQPIECMVPSKFPGSWEQYAENYCWAQDTYFLPFDEEIPLEESARSETKLSYYQWVPFFLLIEAACFRLPSLIWKYLAGHSGIQIHDIVKLAVDEKNVEHNCRRENIRALTIHLQNALRFHRRLNRKQLVPHRFIRFLNLPYSACFVTAMYLLTKVLYVGNVWLQFILMNRFLETDKYSWYGFSAVADVLNGTAWQHSGVFPRVTLCDFKIRVMGNIQTYSVQCVLVINIFNEKIFIFLWFWYTLLLLLTIASFIYWLCVIMLPCFSRWYISRHLELSEMPFDPKGSEKDVERFVASYLKTDGIFVLRMITMHSGIIFGTDLVLSLWKSFYGLEEKWRQEHAPEKQNVMVPPPGQHFLEHTKAENDANQLRARYGRQPALDQQDSNSVGGLPENQHLIHQLTQRLQDDGNDAKPKPPPLRKPPVPPKPLFNTTATIELHHSKDSDDFTDPQDL